MVALCLITVLLFFITGLIGRTFFKVLKWNTEVVFTDYIFVGVVLVNSFFTYYSLLYPTDYIPLIFIFLIACCCLIYLRSEYKAISKDNWIVILATLPLFLIILFIGCDAPGNYDSGLYHIQAIKWIEQYAIVPGLGNLHGRLAFNPNVFNLMAGFSFTNIVGHSLYPINPFITIIFFIYLVLLFKKTANYELNVLCFFLVVGMLSALYALIRLESPTPDVLACLLPVYIVLRFTESTFCKEERFPKDLLNLFLMFIILSFYVVSIKLSAIIVLFLPIIFLIKNFRLITKNALITISLLGILILVPWLIRNYYLSGYLIYPFPELDVFNPDWKIPLDWVMSEKLAIYYWAKLPGPDYGKVGEMTILEWGPKWFANLEIYKKILIYGVLLGSVIALIAYKINPRKEIKFYFVMIFIVSLLGVIFWFFTAPDVRFGFSFLLISSASFLLLVEKRVAALILSLPFIYVMEDPYPRAAISAGIIVCGIMIVVFLLKRFNVKFSSVKIGLLVFLIFAYKINLKALHNHNQLFAKDVITIPLNPDKYSFDDNHPKGILFNVKKLNKYKLSIPKKDEDRCFNKTLPCSPHYSYHEQCVLRGGTLQDGFKIIK